MIAAMGRSTQPPPAALRYIHVLTLLHLRESVTALPTARSGGTDEPGSAFRKKQAVHASVFHRVRRGAAPGPRARRGAESQRAGLYERLRRRLLIASYSH